MSKNKVDIIVEKINKIQTALHRNIEMEIYKNPAIVSAVTSYSRGVSLNYTQEAMDNLHEVIRLTQNKLLVNNVERFLDKEINDKYTDILMGHLKDNKKVTKEEISELIKMMRLESEKIRKYIFPIDGVNYFEGRSEGVFGSNFFASNNYVSEVLFSTETSEISKPIATYLQLNRVNLIVEQRGVSNEITYGEATQIAKRIVEFLNAQYFGFSVKIGEFNSTENSGDEGQNYKVIRYLEINDGGERMRESSNLEFTPCDLCQMIEPMTHEFSFFLTPETNLQKRLVTAISWLGNAVSDEVMSRKFLQEMIALESLFELDSKEMIAPSIVYQIREMVYTVLGTTVESKKEIKRKINSFYDMRSKVVHGEGLDITKEQFKELYEIVHKSINKIILDERFKSMVNISELKDFVEQEKMKS